MKTLPCLALLILAGLAPAKPPQAPPVGFAWAVTDRANPCDCGTACANGPRPNSLGEKSPLCSCDGCRCPSCLCGTVPELKKSYAPAYIADGWTWDAAGGYWYKYPEPAYAPTHFVPHFQPSFAPSFGGFGGGFRSGGGSRGSC